MMKKLLSVLLVAAMLLSVLPMGIFAEDTDGAAYAGEETSLIGISADGRTATAQASGQGLVLTAIYDRGGKRMIAYAKGEEVTLPDDVAGDGECVARAFLLEEDTLIPVCKYAEASMGVLKKAEETTEPTEPEEPKPGNNLTAEMKNGSLWVGGSGTLDGSVNWPKDIDLTAVTSIVVDPNASFETLDAGAFDSFTNLTTLDIGGVKNIGENAFVANTKLTKVTIRTGKLESIGDSAFALESLGGNTVSFEGTKAQWDAIGAPVGAFLDTTTIRMTDSTDKGTIVSGTEGSNSYEDAEPTEETEATEQTQAEEKTPEEQEGMTLEEAAADGYMVLPEGAQAEEAAAAEEMAAFSGKTTGKQADRTTTFTGLMPGQPYQIVVTKLTGAPVGDPEEDPAVLSQMVEKENLVYTNQKVAGSSGSLSFTYEVTTHEDVLVQLYGLANKRGIHLYAANGSETMGENGTVANLTLKLGATGSYQLRAEVSPAQWAKNLEWSVSPQGILDVDEEGNLTPRTAGTAYVKATVKHGTYEFSATCRVLIVNEEAQELKEVTLISTNAALELYKTSGFQLRIHPQLGNKASTYAYDADTVDSYDADEDDETVETDEALGHLIQSAEFGSKDKNDDIVLNDDMNDLFDLKVMDDWSLWLIPTELARENPDKVKSSYKSKIVLHTADQTLLTEETLNISVKKSLPKLTASQLTINGFYNEKPYMPDIQGATVTYITKDPDHENSWPEWLDFVDGEEGELYVNPDVTTKTANAKVWLSVDTEQWAIPAAVQLPVKLIYQAPAVKLASSGITISQSDSYGVKDKLISQDKSLDLKALGVTGARVEDDRLTADYDEENYQLTFYPNSDSYKGTFKTNVYVTIENSSRELVLPLTVNMRAPEMRVSRTNVTLNTLYGDNADLDIHMTPADSTVPELEEDPEITCRKGSKYVEADGQLDVTYDQENKTVSISTNASTEPGANYRVTLKPVGQKPVVIAVKTLALNTKPTVTLKVTGSLDLTYYKKGIKLTETFRNMFGDVDIEYMVRKNNAAPEDFFDYFQEKNDDGEYVLKEDAKLKAGDKLTILVYAKNEDVVACSGSVNLTVKRTAVNIRLSKSTLTLNKDAAQILKISYTVTPSGDNVKKADKPIVTVPSEVNVVEIDEDNQTIKLTAGDDAVYGKTYKVFVKASEADRAATLNVQIANKTNSRIRLSASTSGTIDPTRDSTKVYVKYRASNFNFVDAVDANGDPVYPEVTVWASPKGRTEDWTDVSENFEIRPSTSRASTYSILKLPEAVLNSELKYQVRVTLKDAEGLDVTPAKAVLKVRAGSCSVKPDRTVTVYKSDLKAGHKFRLTSSDKNLNSVEKVTIVDKTLATMYNIEALGDGWFELRPSGANTQKIKTTSIKLNVFVRGMEIRTNAKGEPLPNGTVTLKLTVK